jgi:Flp pilus assembly protein TadG
MSTFRKFLRDRGGNVAVGFGMALLPLAALAGAAIDYSRATTTKEQLQATTDSAALSAARLASSSDAQRVGIAQSFFPPSGVTSDPGPAVSVSASKGVVTINATKSYKTSFMNIVGIGELQVHAHAMAIPTVEGPPVCVLALNQTAPGAVTFAGNTAFSAPNCVVYSNSSSASGISVQGSASVQAAAYCSAGGVSSSMLLTPTPQTSCNRVDDPFRSLTPPASAGCDYRNGLTVNPNNTRALSPGVYCGGLNLKGTVTLSPGLYVIKDGSLSIGSQANVSISAAGGVTFYLTGLNAGLDMDGSGGVNLAAQTTGPYAGLLIVQDRSSNVGATNKLNGNSSTTLKGAIYTPTQVLSVNGNSSFGQTSDFMPLIADQISFSGSSVARLDLTAMPTAAPLPTLASGARLTQ